MRCDVALGDYDKAHEYLRQGLQTAVQIGATPRVLALLVAAAEYCLHIGRTEDSLHLLHAVAYHPATFGETRENLDRLVTRYSIVLSTEGSGASESIDSLVEDLLLAFPTADDDIVQPTFVPKFKQPLIEPLTEREQEVLFYITEGLSNREIAETLVVSISTVKSHINSLYGKLDVSTRDEAIVRAQELSLL
jgi:DNA-binding NarL/FixJ family response regulator